MEVDVKWLTDSEMQAWRSMLIAHAKLYGVLDTELIENHGITFAEYEVLVHTSESEGGAIRMSALADAVLISRSGLTRRVQHLVASGLLEKRECKEDRRGLFAVLTPVGWEKLRCASRTHVNGVRRHLLSKFTSSELEGFTLAMEKISCLD